MITEKHAFADVQIRPADAASVLGCGMTTFWKLAKSDPDFPRLAKISPRFTSISLSELNGYIAKKRGV